MDTTNPTPTSASIPGANPRPALDGPAHRGWPDGGRPEWVDDPDWVPSDIPPGSRILSPLDLEFATEPVSFSRTGVAFIPPKPAIKGGPSRFTYRGKPLDFIERWGGVLPIVTDGKHAAGLVEVEGDPANVDGRGSHPRVLPHGAFSLGMLLDSEGPFRLGLDWATRLRLAAPGLIDHGRISFEDIRAKGDPIEGYVVSKTPKRVYKGDRWRHDETGIHATVLRVEGSKVDLLIDPPERSTEMEVRMDVESFPKGWTFLNHAQTCANCADSIGINRSGTGYVHWGSGDVRCSPSHLALGPNDEHNTARPRTTDVADSMQWAVDAVRSTTKNSDILCDRCGRLIYRPILEAEWVHVSNDEKWCGPEVDDLRQAMPSRQTYATAPKEWFAGDIEAPVQLQHNSDSDKMADVPDDDMLSPAQTSDEAATEWTGVDQEQPWPPVCIRCRGPLAKPGAIINTPPHPARPEGLPHANCDDAAYKLDQHPPHTHVLMYDRTTPKRVWCEGYEGPTMPVHMQALRKKILR